MMHEIILLFIFISMHSFLPGLSYSTKYYCQFYIYPRSILSWRSLMRLRTLQRTKRKSLKMQAAKSVTRTISMGSMCPLTSETEGEMNPETVKYREGSLLASPLPLHSLYLLQFLLDHLKDDL